MGLLNRTGLIRTPSTPPLLLMLALQTACMAGCREPELTAPALDRKVSIDGDPIEWDGALYSFKDLPAAVGILHDQANLYLCLTSSDRSLRQQVLGRGLSIWFDPEGGKKKFLGIRFPLGAREMGLSVGSRNGEAGVERIAWALGDSTATLEILRGDDTVRMQVAQVSGIELRVALDGEVLTYEAKIPLKPDELHPFAIGAGSGEAIGIGLETPEMEPPPKGEMRRGEGPGGPPHDFPGGRGGGGARGGPPGGMRGSREGPRRPGPLKFWIRANLIAPSPPTS